MSTRPVFDPVDTSFDPVLHSQRDDVESPSLSSGNALARFEFEPGRSKDGTKVLMVEWEDDATTKIIDGNWEISWEGKKTVLPAADPSKEAGDELPLNRMYFMLGPGVVVPTSVKLQKGGIQWRTNPLPAIFSPELGATARQAGKKGVLHTIWAKKRLQVLQREIDAETKTNNEGIGLEMAEAEKEWIEENFGVLSKPVSLGIPSQGSLAAAMSNSTNPASPRSPGGGRLMDKLKGLRLGTSSQQLSNRSSSQADTHNPLSPEMSDVAVGSFGSFAALKGMPTQSDLAAKPAQAPQKRMAAQRPPDSFVSRQQQQGGMGSLNAFADNDMGFQSMQQPEPDKADDLFALPMSPRSPDMTKSPFSFGVVDTMNVFGTIEEPLIISSDAGVRYIDGDRQRPRLASIGVFLAHGSPYNISKVTELDAATFTFDRAEIRAALHALRTIKQLKDSGRIPLVRQVVLESDFKLITQAMTDFVTNEWRLNDFTRDGQPIINRDLWWQMEELVTELYNEHHVEMLFFWTPRRFNGAADWLAGAAMDAWDADWKELESLVSS
ncbi:hypothetical protein LTR10_009798 [Elasticomyces elasticus]|nr:hypothetical protein LTR10_009798 [Elasticomyces elasticus]KAK4970088.1 hypothetical protein LTR42_008255 [Elasticomyces elasticus]